MVCRSGRASAKPIGVNLVCLIHLSPPPGFGKSHLNTTSSVINTKWFVSRIERPRNPTRLVYQNMSGFANSTRPTIFWWTPIALIGLRFATQADFFCELRPAQNTRKNQKMLEHSTSTEINCPNFSNSCVIISSKSSVWKPLPLGRERKHRSFLNYRFPPKGVRVVFSPQTRGRFFPVGCFVE